MIYGIDERPRRAWESVLYGWQHTLVDISPFLLPLLVAGAVGLDADGTANLINYGLIAMGLATLIQSTIGNRLPIIQGPSATVIAALVPAGADFGAGVMWGGVLIGAVLETLVGKLRVVGLLRRVLSDQVAGVVIVTIGLALGRFALRLAIGQGAAADLLLAGAVILLSLTIQSRAWGILSRAAIFISIWTVGLGLGSLMGRVDWWLVLRRPWFSLPKLLPWGAPEFSSEFALVAGLAIFAGYLGSIVESVGDYSATCSTVGRALKREDIDRGIFAEGLGCITAFLVGGLPCTSYTQNIGIIALTRVASRHVVRIAAVILMLYGLCPKFGALLVAMPRSVLGGVFILVCGMIVHAGLRVLRVGEADAGDALWIGPALVIAVAVPEYLRGGAVAGLPDILRVLGSNSVVLALVSALGFRAVLAMGRFQSDRLS